MQEIIVGVSGINAVDNPGPGVGVARSLKEQNDVPVKIVGLAYDGMDPGIYMNWLIDKSFMLPYPSAGHEEFLHRLLYIKQSYGLDFVIPNLDTELPLYIKAQEELARNGIRTFVPTLEQFRLRGKDRLVDVAPQIALNLPATEVVTSYDELAKAVERLGLPVMVKGAFYKAYCAQTLTEAAAFYGSIVAEWGYPIIVQRVVAGEEMNVVGVGDGEGGSLGLVAIKKLWRTSLGKIWTGVTVNHPKLLHAAQKFLEVYRWKGGFELECMVNGEDVYLIEINPRLPAWSYFATGVGVNLPLNMLRRVYALPEHKNGHYDAGKLFVRYTYELITDMEPFRNITTRGEN